MLREASGTVFQWGTGLASSGRRLCPGETLPLFLTAKEPSTVTGKALISSESCIHSLSGNGDTGMQKMGTWHFSFCCFLVSLLNSLLVGLLILGDFYRPSKSTPVRCQSSEPTERQMQVRYVEIKMVVLKLLTVRSEDMS